MTDLYTLLREFADSWMLLAMMIFFIGVVLFTLRPGSRKTHRHIAETPFRHEDRPVRDDDEDEGRCHG